MSPGRLVAHDLDRVLVAEVVGALDGVEGVVLGAVLAGVAERGVDAALGRAGVAARRVQLRDDADVGARIVRLDGGAHPGTAGTDHDYVVRRLHVQGSYTKRPSARGGTVGVRSAMIRPPDPPLGDGVVSLRQWRRDDVAVLPGLINGDPEIERWLELMPSPYTKQDAREWIARAAEAWRTGQFLPFAVLAAETGQVVGGLGFNSIDLDSASGEIGYWLSAAARGRGLTTRALRLVTLWGFQALALERIQVRAELENVASCRVAEKAGYRREGVIRSSRYNPRLGRRMDFVLYSALPGEIQA